MLDLGTLQLGVKVNGDAAKQELNKIGNQVEQTGTKTEALGAKAKTMIKAFVAAYAIQELIKLGKAALDAYAKFEQLEGGVNKIFGKDAANEVMQYANKAYKTAGMSANQYMETVTNFSASLIHSMGGNTRAAAKVADMAIRDMSDNANTFGTNMKSIQDAYQGFAKQNYTMLDNLKLGYGGTKTEMERLLSDAEKLTGKKYDLKNLNDVFEAIHAIQQEYNVTGTTAKEAQHTIEGSLNASKAAFENLLTAIGGGKGVTKATTQFLKTLGDVAKNVGPVALNIVKGLVLGMVKAVPKAIGMLGDFMSKLADNLAKGGDSSVGKAAIQIITTLVKGLIKNAPKLAAGAVKLIGALAIALGEAGKSLINTGLETAKNFLKGFSPIVSIIDAVRKAWNKLMKLKNKKKFKIDAPFAKNIQSMKDVYDRWKKILGQKAKKTFEVVKKGFASVLDAMKSIYSKWKSILSQKSTKTFTVTHKSKGSADSGKGHRIGLREVPYDGYVAELHKGEAVVTAAEVNQIKKATEHSDGTTENFTVNVYGTDRMNVNDLALAVEKRIIKLQKRRTEAWA